MNQTGFKDHFSGVANRYADFRPRYPESLFDYLAALCPAKSTAWDCAAGNGQATLDLARRFDQVYATDASQEQIAAAPRLPNVTYSVAPAEASGLPAGSCELITVAQAVHWFDFERFYAEVRRVAKPGGILALWAYGILELEGAAVNQIALEFYRDTLGPYWPPERVLVEQGYRTIPFPFEEIRAPEFQMEAHWSLEQLLGYFSTWSATNRFLKANGSNPLEPLSSALATVWGEVRQPRRITWPLALRVGRVF